MINAFEFHLQTIQFNSSSNKEKQQVVYLCTDVIIDVVFRNRINKTMEKINY